MKKLIAVFLLGLSTVALATDPFTVTVGTNSVQLVANKEVAYTIYATNTVYSLGDVAKNSGYYYFAANAGLSTNVAPTHTHGEVTSGAITWRQIDNNKRGGLAITVKSGEADFSFGTSSAVATNGLRLVGEGHTLVFGTVDNYQGEVHAISGDGVNCVLGVQEF